jgi:hypothetical protein
MSNKYLDYIDLRLPDKIFYKYKWLIFLVLWSYI